MTYKLTCRQLLITPSNAFFYFQVQFLTELKLQVRYTISDADDEFFFDDASTFDDGSGAETNLTDIEAELEFDER